MKTIALLLCMLISVLVAMPCSDGITCEQASEAGQTKGASAAHDHSDDESDLCSPFCTCACCGCAYFVFTQTSFYLKLSRVQTPHFSTLYKSNFSSSYFYSIWQPPKIALS